MTDNLKLSKKQNEVLETILHFIFNDRNRGGFVFSGVAGSGKTTIISELIKILADMKISVRALAFTGKAVAAMTDKGIFPSSTLHSFLYVPVYDYDGYVYDGGVTTAEFLRFDKRPKDSFKDIDFLIIDEASFVPRNIFMDLIELEIPILFVGDSEQLPPIDDTGFNIMDAADIHLEEIHRQAENNPIILLSKIIRETGHINTKYIDNQSIRLMNRIDLNRDFIVKNPLDIILCGTNKVRTRMNQLCRAAKGFHESYAEPGEQVINLKNNVTNNPYVSIYNGEIFNVINVWDKPGHRTYELSYLKTSKGEINVDIMDESWIEERVDQSKITDKRFSTFAFGYAITVHKSQGSEFNNVLYVDDDVGFFTDQRKFRYTAVTRAKNTLVIAK